MLSRIVAIWSHLHLIPIIDIILAQMEGGLQHWETHSLYCNILEQNPQINLATEFGLSTWGRWPQSDIWCIFAFGSSHCSLCTMHQRHVCVCIYIYICHGLSLPWITNQSDSFTMLLQTTKNPGYTLKKTVCVTEKPLPAPPPQVMGPLKFLTTNTYINVKSTYSTCTFSRIKT